MNAIDYWYQKYLALNAKMSEMMVEWLKDRDGCFWDGVEEGKKVMREKMMNEAVEVVVWDAGVDFAPHPVISVEDFNVKDGDKVRIIIVKEDGQ